MIPPCHTILSNFLILFSLTVVHRERLQRCKTVNCLLVSNSEAPKTFFKCNILRFFLQKVKYNTLRRAYDLHHFRLKHRFTFGNVTSCSPLLICTEAAKSSNFSLCGPLSGTPYPLYVNGVVWCVK